MAGRLHAVREQRRTGVTVLVRELAAEAGGTPAPSSRGTARIFRSRVGTVAVARPARHRGPLDRVRVASPRGSWAPPEQCRDAPWPPYRPPGPPRSRPARPPRAA